MATYSRLDLRPSQVDSHRPHRLFHSQEGRACRARHPSLGIESGGSKRAVCTLLVPARDVLTLLCTRRGGVFPQYTAPCERVGATLLCGEGARPRHRE